MSARSPSAPATSSPTLPWRAPCGYWPPRGTLPSTGAASPSRSWRTCRPTAGSSSPRTWRSIRSARSHPSAPRWRAARCGPCPQKVAARCCWRSSASWTGMLFAHCPTTARATTTCWPRPPSWPSSTAWTTWGMCPPARPTRACSPRPRRMPASLSSIP